MKIKMLLMLFLLTGVTEMQAQIASNLRQQFPNPPVEFTQIPFWFWNDEITREGIEEQLRDFKTHGVHAVIPHARMGLSEKVGYMSETWLALVEFTCEQAAKLDMRVCLYDEGMYPSGSAHGAVVRKNPQFAAQGIKILMQPVTGSQKFSWQPELAADESLIGLILLQLENEKILPGSLQIIAEKMLPAEIPIPVGTWALAAIIQTPTRGKIRGVHFGEDDGQPDAPAAADLLNPAATREFIRQTHEKYYNRLSRFFGSTVIGIFTDEPSLSGRGAVGGLKPWTHGFLADLQQKMGRDVLSKLPLLFFEAGDDSHLAFRRQFTQAVRQRLMQSYYKVLSGWCAGHKIALTGHPAAANDLAAQHFFQLPGQDIVWRWVLPGKTALEGEQSSCAKTASSIARHYNRRWVLNECFGAYGWRLTPSEMKWLADWLIVRGTNFLSPHAFYYSVRDQRKFERPPDVGPNNLWWPHYKQFADYTNRLSWLLTDAEPVCECAVAAIGNRAHWTAAKALLENQINFNYLDEMTFSELAEFLPHAMKIGDSRYGVLIIDQPDWEYSVFAKKLADFNKNQIPIVVFSDSLPTPETDLPENIHFFTNENEMIEFIRPLLKKPVSCTLPTRDLRVLALNKSGVDFYLLTNEGPAPFPVTVRLPSVGHPELWDAETGAIEPLYAFRTDSGTTHLNLNLSLHQSKIIAFAPKIPPVIFESENLAEMTMTKNIDSIRFSGWKTRPVSINRTSPKTNQNSENDFPEQIDLAENWVLFSPDGKPVSLSELKCWTEWAEFQHFSGTMTYSCEFHFSPVQKDSRNRWFLEISNVHDFVTVRLNGAEVGTRLWPPFNFEVTQFLQSGNNRLELAVTNTLANELTEETFPAGLFGSVKLIPWQKFEFTTKK